jgi:D-aminopeptidase
LNSSTVTAHRADLDAIRRGHEKEQLAYSFHNSFHICSNRARIGGMKVHRLFTILLLLSVIVPAQTKKPRARDLGVPFGGVPGAFNAITDVKGVEVGYTTLISGEGKNAIRTGVTAILPQGKNFRGRVFAAWHALNGNGEMTGTTWVEESGGFGTPIMITNTHSVGLVRDAVIEWSLKRSSGSGYSGDVSLPVVAETYDGFLNDINGFHVRKEHVFQALNTAATGAIAEGNVGGGTGMLAHGFKGGTGTASRKLDAQFGGYTVGVLVQANYGYRNLFRVVGVPVGQEITDLVPAPGKADEGQGSIIVVVATDAPLLPHQLKRLVKRVSLGIGNMGGRGENSSGDIFIAFSTANAVEASKDDGIASITMLPNTKIDFLFWSTAHATEEAIVNAMLAAETMKGRNGNTAYALPHERLREVLRKYNRLVK